MDPQKILDYGAKLIVIFMCIPIHEYAHAWAATKLGVIPHAIRVDFPLTLLHILTLLVHCAYSS